MTRPTVPVPPGLIDALDCALDTGVRMRPEHICGVLDWLHGVITMNTESHVALSVDELVLIAHALGDAMGAPIHEINTEHVRDIVPKPSVLVVTRTDLPPALEAAIHEAAERVASDPQHPTRVAYARTRAAFPNGGEEAREAFYRFLREEMSKLPSECPGSGNLHGDPGGASVPEYYCAACLSQKDVQ